MELRSSASWLILLTKYYCTVLDKPSTPLSGFCPFHSAPSAGMFGQHASLQVLVMKVCFILEFLGNVSSVKKVSFLSLRQQMLLRPQYLSM